MHACVVLCLVICIHVLFVYRLFTLFTLCVCMYVAWVDQSVKYANIHTICTLFFVIAHLRIVTIKICQLITLSST